MSIDPRHLIQLAAIAETGSFVAAAERLNLAQSALSRNIKTLEERVGAPVLKRGRRGAVPTEIGANLAQFGGVINAANRQADAVARSIASPRADQIRVGATQFIAESFLLNPLGEFMRTRPRLACVVQTGTIEELVELTSLGEVDIALGHFGALANTHKLHVEPLVDDYLTVVARVGHPLSCEPLVTSEALASAGWIVPRLQSRLRWQVENALRYIGVNSIDVVFETSSVAVMIALLQRSDCVAMVPRFAVSPLIQGQQLAELSIDRTVPNRTIGILCRADKRSSAVVTRFCRDLHRFAKQASASGQRARR